MVAVPLPPCDAPEVKRRLYDEYRVEVPVFEWENMPYVRVSFQGYNTQADAERLIAALERILNTSS